VGTATVPASLGAIIKGAEAYRALAGGAKALGMRLSLLVEGVGAGDFDRFFVLSRDLVGGGPIVVPLSPAAERLVEVWPGEVLTYSRPGGEGRAVYLSNEGELREALELAGKGAFFEAVVCGTYEGAWLRRSSRQGPWRSVLDGKLATAATCLALRAGAKKVVLLPGRALVYYPDRPLDLAKSLEEGRKSALYGALKTLVEEFGPRRAQKGRPP